MVSGVAHLDGLLYIVFRKYNTLIVYDDTTFLQQDSVVMTVEGVKWIDAYDMAACKRSHCLFVTDVDNKCIFKLADCGHTIIKWLNRHSWVTIIFDFVSYEIFLVNTCYDLIVHSKINVLSSKSCCTVIGIILELAIFNFPELLVLLPD